MFLERDTRYRFIRSSGKAVWLTPHVGCGVCKAEDLELRCKGEWDIRWHGHLEVTSFRKAVRFSEQIQTWTPQPTPWDPVLASSISKLFQAGSKFL